MRRPRRSPLLLLCLGACLLMAGCMRNREVEKDLKIVDVRTGWYDAGIVNGNNKLVPSVTLKLQNVSGEAISSVQLLAVFHRVDEADKAWGDHFVRGVDANGLAAGATGGDLTLRGPLGYTGVESRQQMMRNKLFVDATVVISGKHGSRNWTRMGEFPISRELLAKAK
jgi:hypothetical protein